MNTQGQRSQSTGASGRTRADWIAHLSQIGEDHGFFERIGAEHFGFFVEESDVLLVSFDHTDRVFAEAKDGFPRGFDAVQRRGWSLLSIMGRGTSWFRSTDLYDFFDGLTAAGFFDSFTQVLFMGFGPACGHAACAYSVAAPDARVFASAPVSCFDAERAGFDRRLRRLRQGDLSRYADAPEALLKAQAAALLYDPTVALDAAHIAAFSGDGVTKIPLRFAGSDVRRLLEAGDVTVPTLRALANDRLDRHRMAELLRPVRRADGSYLWGLLQRLEAAGHFDRAYVVADYAADVIGEERFEARAEQLRRSSEHRRQPAS